ncbi:MAG TPA: VCBS repeat-containing protein [Bryobacteraceae bacterium]|jgi:hypothetical protein
MAVGDFNGDGKLDVITRSSTGLSLLLGDGSGHFSASPAGPIPLPTGPNAVATGDFNGDGNLDLAVGDMSDTHILLGNGSGGFTPGPAIIPSNFHIGAVALAVADLNHDGKQDLMFSSRGHLYVALGDGAGGFQLNSLNGFGVPYSYSVAIADFDGDGNVDMAFAGFQNLGGGQIEGWSNAGLVPGSFLFALGSDPFFNSSPYSIADGDFNGDGKIDLITTESPGNFGQYAVVWLQSGSAQGGFLTFTPQRFPLNSLAPSVVVADFNGDGKLDWATANLLGNVTVELGDGAGGFTPAAGSPFAVGGQPFSILARDLNGDGKLDLLIDTGIGVAVLVNSVSSGAGQQAQVIQFFIPQSQAISPTPFTITATASSGLPVSFASATPANCTVSGNSVTMVLVGTCTITANQLGNSTYSAAPAVNQSFNIVRAMQFISSPPVANQLLGTPPFILVATASSGLPVTFASQTQGICTVSGSTVTLVATGACMIGASQAGDSNYYPAISQSIGFFVQVAQSITFAPLNDRTLGTPAFSVNAIASSGLPVTFSSSTIGVCQVTGGNVTLVAVGTCSITASQAGNPTYAPAPPVTQSFNVTAGQTQQTITFGPLPNRALGTGPFTISAIASSGLPVSLSSSTPNVCGLSGTSCLFNGLALARSPRPNRETQPTAPRLR